MLKKLLLSSLLAGSLAPLSGIAMEGQPLLEWQEPTLDWPILDEMLLLEEQNPQSEPHQKSEPQPLPKLSTILYRMGGSLIISTAVLYGSVFIHELGHKYAGKLLMGVDGTIHWSWTGTPYVYFHSETPFTPVSLLIMFASGPAAGIATSYGIKKIADKYLHKYKQGSNKSYLCSTLYTSAYVAMLANASCLIPHPQSRGSSDGTKILQILKYLLSNKN